MRMWMCNPKIMCRQHLIGEYRELFTFLGTLKKKKKVDGYFKNNLFEPLSLQNRYDKLVKEMKHRGYKPKKKFKFNIKILTYLGNNIKKKVNRKSALNDLISRCSICKENYLELSK